MLFYSSSRSSIIFFLVMAVFKLSAMIELLLRIFFTTSLPACLLKSKIKESPICVNTDLLPEMTDHVPALLDEHNQHQEIDNKEWRVL